MKITTFIQKIESYTPPGYEFWAGVHRSHYNAEKQVNDTCLMVVPKTWPVKWREGCKWDAVFEVWLGKVWPIRRDVEQMQEHRPYTNMEAMQALHSTAGELVASINTDDHILVTSAAMTFYDAPEARSVNSQFWLKVQIAAKVYSVNTGFDHILNNQL